MLFGLTWSDVGDWFAEHGVVIAVIVLVTAILARMIARIVPRVVRPAIAQQMDGRPAIEVDRRADTLASVIVRTTQGVLVTIAVITILPELGVDITPLLASVGIVSIALGLGAQALVRDWLNGLFILSENHYARGDVVTIAGITGTVEDMSIRRTVLRDVDGVLYSVPHGNVTVTANASRDFSRVRIAVPVSVTSDLAKVRDVIDRVGRELAADPQWKDKIVSAPAFLRVDNIDANGVAMQVNGTVRPGSQLEVAGELRTRLLEAFRREEIRTPWG